MNTHIKMFVVVFFIVCQLFKNFTFDGLSYFTRISLGPDFSEFLSSSSSSLCLIAIIIINFFIFDLITCVHMGEISSNYYQYNKYGEKKLNTHTEKVFDVFNWNFVHLIMMTIFCFFPCDTRVSVSVKMMMMMNKHFFRWHLSNWYWVK